ASVRKTSAAGTVVGLLTGTDPDPSQTFTFSLVSGTGSTDNAKFTIVGNELRVKAPLGTGTKASIRLRVTDQNGLWFEKTFSISLTN
ncbi:MAG TPA: cadherin repeat domain-containing protein, partial [Caulifigura sp.]|nr:cadherin repeat domain-containing protein [Caulifigura sp.]